MGDIRHIVTSPRGDLFLTAEFEHRVQVWSSADRELLAEFDTVLDFGGRRLAVCGIEEPIVVAGAYFRHGICGYAQDGSVLWQRKDLKKVQVVAPAEGGELVAACFSEGPMRVLDAASGETIASVRAIRDYADHLFGVGGFGELFDEVAGVGADWQLRWKAPVEGLTILRTAVGPNAITVASSGGASSHSRSPSWVTAFDHDGRQLWRWRCPSDSNCIALAWDQGADAWAGVINHVMGKKPHMLVRWSPDGVMLHQGPLGVFPAYAFSANGHVLITADGAVRDSASGEIVWELPGR